MTISDAIHDNMMNLLDEIVEWHADRLQSPRYRETVLNMLAAMHNAVCALDGFGESCTMEESHNIVMQLLDEKIEQSKLCEDDDDDDDA